MDGHQNGAALVKQQAEPLSVIGDNRSFLDDSDIDIGVPQLSSGLEKPVPVEVESGPKANNRGFRCADKENKIYDSSKAEELEDFNLVANFNELATLTLSDIDKESLPVSSSSNDANDVVLKMYWMDAYEDTFKNPGSVYLFGRVWVESSGVYTSCCVIVRNVEKILFFLPREKKLVNGCETGEELCFEDVYSEIQTFLGRFGITDFRIKKSTRKYAFGESDVPAETEYLEVHYNAGKFRQPIPSDSKGDTFSRVFRTTSSGLEVFLLERHLKGPGWLEIRNFQRNTPQVSWCAFEVVVNDMNSIEVVAQPEPSPKISIATLNFLATPSLKNSEQEIVAGSLLVHKNFAFDKPQRKMEIEESYCYICKPSNSVLPFDFRDQIRKAGMKVVETVGNERALLNLLLLKIQKSDPDVIAGHDILGYGLDLLMHRLSVNKVPNWSRIGRLRRSGPAPRNTATKAAHVDALAGRICLDIKVAAKELIRCKSYDMSELCSRLLDAERLNFLPDQILQSYRISCSVQWWKPQFNRVYYMELQASPNHLLCPTWRMLFSNKMGDEMGLESPITQIVGGVMSRTVMGGRSERNEFLLLHAFHDRNYLVPDKGFKKKTVETKTVGDELEASDGKKKASYTGGLVLEPKKGLYDCYVLLLDFNSLYPSIIQEFNICFTTNTGSRIQGSTEAIPEVAGPSLPPGILPTEIRKLVDSRREVKKLMKIPNLTPEQSMQYNIRQMALKLTANSMYGCLGFAHSRFYAKPLAALITAKGREILLHTKELAERLGLEVIYGDTDSIMINSNSYDFDEVMKQGKKVKQEVNKLYKLLELDIDGVYKCLLLLKKKKYAGLAVENLPNGQTKTRRELKGLDIVRRDWSELAKDAGNFVIDEILSAKTREATLDNIHQHLIELGERIKKGDVELEKFEISKQLTKSPKEYTDKKGQAHVLVALRMNENGKAHYKQGDTVAYVICQDGTNNPATQRAYSIQELHENEKLVIDAHYYLSQQVHPVVSRVCGPIEGTDAARIAECLGLDASSYQHRLGRSGDGSSEDLDPVGPILDFAQCQPLSVTCPKPGCCKKIEVSGPFVGQGWLMCEDPACSFRSRRIPVRLSRDGHVFCPCCQQSIMFKEVSEKQLFAQLSFYQRIFDIDRGLEEKNDLEIGRLNRISTMEIRQAYADLKDYMDDILCKNAYSEVNLGRIFQCLLGPKFS